MTYASATSMSRNSYRVNKNNIVHSTRKSGVGPATNTIVLVLLACLLTVIYLSQVTRTNSYSYQLDGLTTEKTQLQEEYASLEVESAKLESVERIRQSQVATELVNPASIQVVN